MEEFLAPENLCGQTLLRLVSRGSAIIAELQRLQGHIPKVFRTAASEAGTTDPATKYGRVLFNFSYLRAPEDHERRINASNALLDLDEEFGDTFSDLVARFFGLFESIVVYIRDFNKFAADVDAGYYIQHTVENILLDDSGRQLMCEALYLFGVMLLLLERHIPGPVRERMVIAYVRHHGEVSYVAENMEDVCRLCRSTGFVSGKDKPRNYPESFFARFAVHARTVSQVIGRMQNDDIYMQAVSFPLPEHRTTRLAAQGSMIYVCLYFAPELLKRDAATMREVVDRHFSDNWVIPAYMGYLVDLSMEWAGYPAALAALGNVLSPESVRRFAQRSKRQARRMRELLREYLTQGRLDEAYLLSNLDALMACLRECNVTLRWIFLHHRTRNRLYAEAIRGNCVSDEELVSLLLQTAQLEWRLKAMFQTLLDEKDAKWREGKAQASGRLHELSQYFTGEVLLTRVRRDESMTKWFANVAATVEKLDYEEEHATVTGRKIREILRALEDVETFEQLEESLQVKSFLEDTRNILRQMLRTVNITGLVMSQMEAITDLAYAWELLNDYMAVLHQRIEAEPQTVVLLRATFLKLASILDVPLTRITQCDSQDVLSVAEYYSAELVHFVRRVVEIIPKNVFQLLHRIVELQSERMRPLPIKFEAEKLKDFAQLEERFELAKLTHRVSVFTEGILAMERTLLGAIQVDPRQILEEGLRKELVHQVATAMHSVLVFPLGTAQELGRVAQRLGAAMELFRTSMEYIQDYIDLAGLKIWQEEMHRIVNFAIEQETNAFLKRKVLGRQSRFQSREVPMPQFKPVSARRPSGKGLPIPVDVPASTFMGRVVNALLHLTDAASTTYAPECMTWYGAGGSEACGLRLCAQLSRGVGIVGIHGIDRLLGFHIVHALREFFGGLKALSKEHGPFLERLRDRLAPEWKVPSDGTKLYANASKKAQHYMLPLLECCRRVGRAQLLRLQFARLLEFRSRSDAQLLHSAVRALNDGIMAEFGRRSAEADFEGLGRAHERSPVSAKARDLLDACGLSDPFSKVYVIAEPVEGLPMMLLLFVVSYLPKLRYDAKLGTLVRLKDKYPIDGAPVIAGVATLLRQFHPSYTRAFLAFLSQYARTMIQGGLQSSKPGVPGDIMTIIIFTRQFCDFSGISREECYAFFPQYAFDAVHMH